MDINRQRMCILSQLKKRNSKEHSFQELIKYSNKLLESLDFLQKETLYRKYQSPDQLTNEPQPHNENAKSEESALIAKCHSLQEDLKQCHVKISDFAQQILELKKVVEEKNDAATKQATELDQIRRELNNSKELNDMYQRELLNLKVAMQDKMDEFDALNITFSSVENKKNDLEMEIRKLKNELQNLEKSSASSESSKSSITSALISAANDISLPQTAKTQVTSKKDISVGAVPTKSTVSSIPSTLKYDFIAHDSEVNAVLWLPQMPYFVTAGADRKVKVWEMKDSGVELKESIRGCNSSILSVDIDCDANLLLCASSDFASRVWTLCDFMIRHTLTGHSGKVTSSKFMNETNRIVSGSYDQTLKLWDLRQRVCIVTYNTSSPVHDVVSRPSNFIISGHSDKKIRVWDPRVGSEVIYTTCKKVLTSLDLSKTGYCLLASEKGNYLRLYDIRMMKEETHSLTADNFEVGYEFTRAKFSPDNKYCCCGSKDGSIFIWNISSGNLEKQLHSHSSNVISCCWSSCGTFLASCDKNKHCIIWN